ncbi:MAG TPA: hypothetical protein VIP70_12565 [Nitrososphaeraceae archaeon]
MSDLALPLSAFSASSSRAERRFPIDCIRLQAAMSDLAFKRNWKKAEQLSLRSRARAFSMLSILEGEHRTCVREKNLHVETCKNIVTIGNEMLTDENFVTKLKKSGLLSEFKRAVKNRKSSCEGIRGEFPFFKVISEHSQYVVAMGYTGFWGGFHAIFNQYIDKSVPKSFSLPEIRKIEKMLKTEQSSVSNNLFKLYSVIRKGNRDHMLDTSRDILHSQEFNIFKLSAHCASICVLTSAVLNGEIDGDAKKLGQLDLLAGKLARSWILLIVWALYVAYLGLLTDGDTRFQQTVKAVRKLPFLIKKKRAKLVSPKTLSSEGPNYDGKYVQINGFVKNMTTKRTQDGKFLNLFEVYEHGSDKAVRVAVIFEHMGHRGLVNTSYVELYGIWKETSPLADRPVLQLERLKISELGERSGFEYMVKTVRPWFDFYPNSYHAYWSVRPQKTAGSGPGSMLTGAGELIVIDPFSSGRGER